MTRSFPLLLLGSVLIGFGNASNQLSRYAAADLFPASRRASAIGIVVWGATFGAVIGPNLVGWAGQLGESIGLPPLAGAYLLPIIFVGSAAVLSFAMLRPDPYRLADQSDLGADDRSTVVSLRAVLAHPNVPVAMVSLITGPGRDDPDHDHDPAPHDRARPRPDRGRDRHQRPHLRDVRPVPRSPAG